MAELFETMLRYEIAFWDMAMSGDGWPGVDPGPRCSGWVTGRIRTVPVGNRGCTNRSG